MTTNAVHYREIHINKSLCQILPSESYSLKWMTYSYLCLTYYNIYLYSNLRGLYFADAYLEWNFAIFLQGIATSYRMYPDKHKFQG